MSPCQRILLIADPGRQRLPAFERAAQIATATGATLSLCLFDYSKAIAAVGHIDESGAAKARDEFMRHCDYWVHGEAVILRGRGLQATSTAKWSRHVAEDIITHALEVQADLVIKDVRLASPLSRVLMSPLDWQLLRECPVPLLLVNSSAHPLPRRIIAAVDVSVRGSESEALNDEVLRSAIALATSCKADLHLAFSFDAGNLFDTLRAPTEAAFKQLATDHGVAEDHRHFLVGDPAEQLADLAANSQTDIIVIGTGRALGLDRLVIGSTAEKILDGVACDVLAVKTRAYADKIRAHHPRGNA